MTAQVILRDPTLWYQTIEVDKGSDDGVALHDPVIGDGALVGEVTEVSADGLDRHADHRSHRVGDRAGAGHQRRHRRARAGRRQPGRARAPVPPAAEPGTGPERPAAGSAGGHRRDSSPARSSRTSRPTSRSGTCSPARREPAAQQRARSRSRRSRPAPRRRRPDPHPPARPAPSARRCREREQRGQAPAPPRPARLLRRRDPGVGDLPGVDLRRERRPDAARRDVGRPVVRLAHRGGVRVRHRPADRPRARPDAWA